MTTGRPLRADLPVVTIAVAVCAATGLGYRSFFASDGYLVPVLGAAVVSGLLTLALRSIRLSGVLFAVAAGFLAYAAVAIYARTTPVRDLPVALVKGVAGGWSRMLATGLPADVEPDLLAPPALTTWFTTAAAIIVSLRTGLVLTPLLPVLAAYVIGLLLTADQSGSGLAVAALVLGLSLLFALVRAANTDGGVLAGQLRHGLPTGAAVLAVAALCAVGVPLATGSARFDPRTLLPPHVEITDHLTPLVTVKQQLREAEPRRLFSVQFTGEARTTLIRTAALEQFDGALWTSDDTFLRAGRTLIANDGLDHAVQVTADVAVAELPGPYLPALGTPRQITASGLGFDNDSGVLVSTAKSLRDFNYTVISSVPLDDGRMIAADPVRDEQHTALPPGTPALVKARAEQWSARADNAYAKLTAIESNLRSLPYDLDAQPGHSYAAVERLLSGSAGGIGYAEQHASAFAIMARSLGYPARVVCGYRLVPERVVAGRYEVTSHEAHAWAEVRLAGYGWVPFDPTDLGEDTNPRGTSAEPAPPTQTPGVDPTKGADTATVNPELPPPPGPGWFRGFVQPALLLLPALASLALLLVVAVKRWRRRRRAGGSPADRVTGAWRETIERLRGYGLAVPRSATANTTGTRACAKFGDAAASVPVLAELVTAAVFGSAPTTPGAAATAWELEATLHAELRQSLGRAQAVRVLLDPRPLLGPREEVS